MSRVLHIIGVLVVCLLLGFLVIYIARAHSNTPSTASNTISLPAYCHDPQVASLVREISTTNQIPLPDGKSSVPADLSKVSVQIPAGEPSILATVQGQPIVAHDLKIQVSLTLKNNAAALNAMLPQEIPPAVLASLQRSPDEVRSDIVRSRITSLVLFNEAQQAHITVTAQTAINNYLVPEQPDLNSLPSQSLQRYQEEAAICYTLGNNLQAVIYEQRIGLMRKQLQQQTGLNGSADLDAYIQQHLWPKWHVQLYITLS